MTTSQYLARHRDQAEVYHGESICKKKSLKLFGEFSLLVGLLPLDNIEEVGHNRVTGFVWLKQKRKRKKKRRFNSIGRVVSYEPKVTAFVEEHHMRRVNGVKTKELFIWITIADISIDCDNAGKITFANPLERSRKVLK